VLNCAVEKEMAQSTFKAIRLDLKTFSMQVFIFHHDLFWWQDSCLRLIPMGSFILLFPRVSHHQNTNETIDETHPTMHWFMFGSHPTHQVLVTMYTWFHLDETHFISLLIKLVSHHLKLWHDILFNVHEILMKPPLGLALLAMQVLYEKVGSCLY